MIMSMYNIVCVTNRKLCNGDFLERIEEIAKCQPKAIILREKDISEQAYEALAIQVLDICKQYDVRCILHSFVDVAIRLQADAIHVPLPILRNMRQEQKEKCNIIGASCHTVEEAKEAEQCGCTYITAGHIFVTDCKKGVPARGLDFLKAVCESVSIPVYAIGGISGENIQSVCMAGAESGCVMSGLMQCSDVADFMEDFKK